MSSERGVRLGFLLAALVLAADVITKVVVVAQVDFGASHEWLPMLNIVHVLNRGAAFSFLHDAGGWQRGFFIAIALVASVFLVFMIRRAETSRMERVSFGLILGGALANMFDRIVRGAVVDWIDVHWGPHHWPAFNMADVGISIGALLLVAHGFLGKKQLREANG
ncbi:signal peptidase II [Rhizobacter sp. J219]|uniref:signal peptidase II n=1 Tax=Rhizobacter sp. J219 TaxID=2898430 RepID=UPI0021515F02|nr:signal peptidase II [Rhizobacter sp. J219]MCR5882197.1 signal peptidase II [Rhizobacter sp. J219]